MTNIYDDIFAVRQEYKELGQFGGGSFFTQEDEKIYSIEHQYQSQWKNQKPFEFGLTIVGIDEPNPYSDREGSFSFGFSLLDVKFVGYQSEGIYKKSFDIYKPIQKYGKLLLDEQQKHLPLKLTITSAKKVFKIGEKIDIRVTLENIGKRTLKVKNLDTTTLFFLYDNAPWGATEMNSEKSRGTKEIVFRPGEKMSKNFTGSSFDKAKKITIFGSYIQTFKGVHPSGVLSVRVQE